MYTLQNGILFRAGVPQIALGTSYYPSFHEGKFPVPPEGDRAGEMRKDLRAMRDAGMNIVRVAALGDVSLDAQTGEVRVDTPFIDDTLAEAARNGLAGFVRLQGYVMNFRGNTDYLMRNERDEEMALDWSAFMQSSLFHQGILRDNLEATAALAEHYARMPDVVAYQMYNEPHYPYRSGDSLRNPPMAPDSPNQRRQETFDYHPATLAAYRAWRACEGLPPAEPPRNRPLPDEPAEPWAEWRLFNMRAMSRFLNDTARASRKAAPQETMTCMTTAPACPNVMGAGINYFDNAEGMEVVGITSYTHLEGVEYYTACYTYDMAESAAALCGKHAWIIESDARTQMPARKLHEQTYALLGAGHKGILYYEWRGDYPYHNTPLPDNCGFIYSDGRKAGHYDRSLDMLRFVGKHSARLASAEKARCGVAVLHSDHAEAYADAYRAEDRNAVVADALRAYRELRSEGVSVDIVEARHLAENRLGVRALFIPCQPHMLSETERAQVDAFCQGGGSAYYLLSQSTFGATCPGGWWDWTSERLPDLTSEFRSAIEAADALEAVGIAPPVRVSSRHLKVQMLAGDGYRLAILVNTDPVRRDVTGARVTLSFPAGGAVFVTPDGETPLDIVHGAVTLPTVAEGGMLILEE